MNEAKTAASRLGVAIVDYGSGNLHSAHKAFERAASETGYAGTIAVTHDPEAVALADRIVLPGVGAFADCRRGLNAVPGMIEAMEHAVRREGKPFLGICVGMQLLATRGLEHETTAGLDWIKGEVAALEPTDKSLKIPHMGWNTLTALRPHPLLAGIPLGAEGLHAYFVHSYAFRPQREADLIATTDYGGPVTAMIGEANIAGTQFHPEKSQTLGLALISNFLKWHP
ncbi:imidazole glycerol phosphate synthase subunit HisH [Beijerinckia indica]|uniref:Imidazole glycerol phosphate synthase subunit HisH n=1 Tax=Beijerinckia indica subsp. indica (strain ATCC 9039 / DSM 1715 / NCIMB 8712) TaxID=395963 RepID=B2ICL4_BEII9|nr:imidazole glycerol phosphate synthase subunit HisH [Beijerinckia indica]ACB93903.1 imidazole glycerol phosphate synthase, glutamine amidotransferase subunit [Beijerinckia indica subsp. indica ATCC 9039]